MHMDTPEAHKHAEAAERISVGPPIKMDNQAPPPGYEGRPRNGGWISTYTGRPFWPCDPELADIDIRDIAHALSNQCRFAGHVRRFYSVAEHSVRVMNWLIWAGAGPGIYYWGLMHDTPEAYLVDLPRPLKHTPGLGEAYQQTEITLMNVIAEKFDLSPAVEPDAVKHADLVILESERLELLPTALWAMGVEPEPEEGRKTYGWSPERAEIAFLTAFAHCNGVASLPY